MTDVLQYTFASPLEGYEGLPPLPTELNEDGKSFKNEPSTEKSPAYDRFVDPISNGRSGGFDIHIYYEHRDEFETKFANQLWERIRREFPELRIYRVWDRAIGPHTMAMFEVNVFSPAQFGAFLGWLVINRGPLSALIHPNTDDEFRDHTQLATWMGPPVTLNVRLLQNIQKNIRKQAEAKAKLQQEAADAQAPSTA